MFLTVAKLRLGGVVTQPFGDVKPHTYNRRSNESGTIITVVGEPIEIIASSSTTKCAFVIGLQTSPPGGPLQGDDAEGVPHRGEASQNRVCQDAKLETGLGNSPSRIAWRSSYNHPPLCSSTNRRLPLKPSTNIAKHVGACRCSRGGFVLFIANSGKGRLVKTQSG